MEKSALIGIIIVLACVTFVVFMSIWATIRINRMAEHGYGSARWAIKKLKENQ